MALFAKSLVAAPSTVDVIAVEINGNPSEIISQQDIEQPVEQAPEIQAPQNVEEKQAETIIVEEVDPQEAAEVITEQVSPIFAALQTFVQDVATGQADVVTGIFVNEEFALDVVQQPANNPGFISEEDDVVTDFAMARDYGTIGMLAHNYLAGEQFDELVIGDEIYLVYGDNQFTTYTIVSIENYQALSPHSPTSDFVRLDDGSKLSATDLFYRVYGQEDALVLQTCIENEGELSWGRLFIIAEPTETPTDVAMVVNTL
jgi:hypothetical protein